MMTAMQMAKEDLEKADRDLAAINPSNATEMGLARETLRKALDRYQVAAGLHQDVQQTAKAAYLETARATVEKRKAAYDDFLTARTSKREEMEKTFRIIFGQLFEIIDSDSQLNVLASQYFQACKDAEQPVPCRAAPLAIDFLAMVRRPVLLALIEAQSTRQSAIHWPDVLRILELER